MCVFGELQLDGPLAPGMLGCSREQMHPSGMKTGAPLEIEGDKGIGFRDNTLILS